MTTELDTRTPVLILDGKENSLSLARHFGRLGIPVRVSGPAHSWGMYSRYCRAHFGVPANQEPADYWRNLLLSDDRGLDGHILFACSDESIEFIANHFAELQARFILDDGRPELQMAMLDKKRTLEIARANGVPTPNFWLIDKDTDLQALQASITFPVIVKPLHSHKFTRVFHKKLFIIENSFDELIEKVEMARAHGLEIMIMEMIPGPDDLLSSYYTYIDRAGRPLFHYTKRILRRYPTNRGNACYHITEWLPETAKLGQTFFEAIGFHGLGNIEFKCDSRDGQLKMIEVNARFTAAQELLVRSGAPIHLILYCHLTNQPAPHFDRYTQFLTYWYPLQDLLAFLELHGRGELSFFGWVKSLLPFRHVSPLWTADDLMPAIGAATAITQKLIRG